MTLAGKVAALFPLAHLAIVLWRIYELLLAVTPVNALLVLGAIYVLPVALFRVHNLFFPLKDSISDIAKKEYNRWWTAHQLQMSFVAIPALEGPIHLIPGAFSVWLRLWGSKVGKGVYWTPKVEIVDRGLLEVGDNVVVGHMTAFCSHAVTPVDGKTALVVKKIRIGERAFVGAESRLGPGATVEPRELLKYGSKRWWKGDWDA